MSRFLDPALSLGAPPVNSWSLPLSLPSKTSTLFDTTLSLDSKEWPTIMEKQIDGVPGCDVYGRDRDLKIVFDKLTRTIVMSTTLDDATPDDGNEAGLADGTGTGYADGNGTGLADGTGTGNADGSETGLADGSETGLADGTGTGVAYGIKSGLADGTGSGVADGIKSGVVDGNGTGNADGNGTGLADGT